MEIDPATRTLYWTDRGDPPRGNTVNRAPLDSPWNERKPPAVVLSHLMEGIGLALDVPGNRMFATDMAGHITTAGLDGHGAHAIAAAQGNLTGIAYMGIVEKAG